jgi:hypothetical protein
MFVMKKFDNKDLINKILYKKTQEKPDFTINHLLDNYEDKIEAALIEVFQFNEINSLSLITDFSEFNINLKSIRKEKKVSYSIEENKIITFELKFDINYDNEYEEKTLYLDFPEYENGYFTINNVDYTPLFQLADKGSYVNSAKNKLIFKTLLMPIILMKKVVKFKNKNIKPIKIKIFKTNVNVITILDFNSQIDCLKYYGLDRTDFFLTSNKLSSEEEKEILESSYYDFKMKGKSLYIFKDIKPIIADTIADYIINSGSKNISDIEDEFSNLNYKIKIFGTKLRTLSISLERVLDPLTKSNLNNIDEKDKKDIYSLIRYHTYFYDELFTKDTFNFKYKRLKLEEFAILPLVHKLSESKFRIFNSSKRNQISLRRLSSILNIPRDFFLKKLIVDGLIRPISSSNGILLYQKLKATLSVGNGSDVSIKQRDIDQSAIGHIGICYSSASDPGATVSLCCYSDVNEDGFYSDEIEYITPY